jgi:hypothetical protein
VFTTQHYRATIDLLLELDISEDTFQSLNRLFKNFFAQDNKKFSDELWDTYIVERRDKDGISCISNKE